jgi:hypothetical protein
LPSLTAEVAGKVWLFTLGPQGGATPGGTKVAEIGPVPSLSALCQAEENIASRKRHILPTILADEPCELVKRGHVRP